MHRGTRHRGRYAPTPSGLIHVGNARTALVAWLSTRSQGGQFLWRLEDLDPPRSLIGAAQAAIDDLRWLGLDWDEGPDLGGPHAPYVQSERSAHYDAALRRLASQERIFPCRLSRKDLRDVARAPHGTADGEHGEPRGVSATAYPAELRPTALTDDWFEKFGQPGSPETALRFKVKPGAVHFEDQLQGEVEEHVEYSVGDFVLKRKDGLYAYQLAVVVDDLAMGITEVVRGVDLLDSTARQIQLARALGGEPPRYGHVPLVLNADGEKLSKRDGGLTLRALRDAGISAHQLVGHLAHSLGLAEDPRPITPLDLIKDFKWQALPREPWILPEGWLGVQTPG